MSNKIRMYKVLSMAVLISMSIVTDADARDLEYKNGELSIYVSPSEPTQVQLPGTIAGGFKKKLSALSLDRKETDLIIFANEGINDTGEAIIVRLQDGRSYSIRVKRASQENPRDDVVKISDRREGVLSEEEEAPLYKEKKPEYAPPTEVSGLMREMVLAAEFGKSSISGYRVSENYKGEQVLNDGTLNATIDKIFMGPNLWGYVLNAENLLDQTQRVNPASFRLHGARAISVQNWELSPRPMNVEQQVAAKHRSKIYIITRAKSLN